MTLGSGWAAQIPFPATNLIDGAFTDANAVYAADVDGDGDADVLGAGTQGDKVAWWRNDGAATNWSIITIDAAFADADDVVAKDLDGDGDVDAVGAAAGTTDDVVWWENDGGAGTNWIKRFVNSNFNGARGVAVGDMDGDGDCDVSACAVTLGAIAWWANLNGSGTLWSATRTIDGNFASAEDVFVADMDRDGDLDALAAGSATNMIAWWENVGGLGTAWVRRVVAADFEGASSVHAADLNGDGEMDIAGVSDVPAPPGGLVGVWLNQGGGTNWLAHLLDSAFNRAMNVHCSDVDKDGDLDVLGAAASANDIAWWENLGSGGMSWSSRRLIDGSFSSARAVHTADVDGNGNEDVLGAASFSGGRIAWWPNRSIHRSAAICAERLVGTGVTNARALALADYTCDGALDVMSATDAGLDLYVSDGSNRPAFTTNVVVSGGSSVREAVAADLDKDGDDDVVAAVLNLSGSDVVWLENNGAATPVFTQRVVATGTSAGADAVAVLDLDRDRDRDIVAPANNALWMLRSNGAKPPLFTTNMLFSAPGLIDAVTTGDLNRDGRPDLVTLETGFGAVRWHRNEGGSPPSFASFLVWTAAVPAVSSGLTAGDLDGDGDTDLLFARDAALSLVWMENDGAAVPAFTTNLLAGTGGAGSTRLADLDHDGDLDIVSALGAAENVVAWFENDGGAQPLFVKRAFTTDVSQTRVALGDLERDGDADVVSVAAGADGAVRLYANQGGQLALITADIAPVALAQSQTGAVLSVRAAHRGRTGDSDEELTILRLYLARINGAPLSSGQANALIENLTMYADTGSGLFEPSLDTLVVSLTTLELGDGRQDVSFSDSDPLVQVSQTSERLYFVVVELTTFAANQMPNAFRVAHLADPEASISSGGEDRAFDIPLALQCDGVITTKLITVVGETDLALTKSGSPDLVVSSSNVVYTLVLTNRGANNAAGVVLTDTLPTQVTAQTAGFTGPCFIVNGVLTCDFGLLAVGTSKVTTITVAVHTNAVGTLTNSASVATLSMDTNAANDSAAVTTAIRNSDGDGLPDFADDDDDNDLMSDFWEIAHGFNPTNGSDAALNADLDLYINLEEFIADTDPNDSNSFFRVEAIQWTGTPVLQFGSSAQRLYTLQYMAQPAGIWSNVEGRVAVPIAEDEIDDPNPIAPRLYRLQVDLPQ